jgi:hypothetical protein
MRTPYRHKSRETQIVERAAGNINRVINRAVGDNPLPIGETRIDPRTARKRQGLIPPDQMWDHLSEHG